MKVTIIAGNGIGGTEKAAFIYAAELAHRGHQVMAITNPDGPRSKTLHDAGVEMHDIPYRVEAIHKHLEVFKPDVVHQHVSGYSDQRVLYNALDQITGQRPKIIETNVFGRLMDRYDRGHVSFRMFVSLASGCQAFQRPTITKITPDHRHHSVLTNPLSRYTQPTPEKRALLRAELGVHHDDFLLIRIGQAGRKWTAWDCAAFSIARRKCQNLKLLLMQPPAWLAAEVQSGRWGDGIIVREVSSDFEYLSVLYGSADGMLHASDYGESFGYTLAEAMQAGLPIITLSTPWGDNAQVQLVQNSITGFVCCSVGGMAEAILKICTNESMRLAMSGRAQVRVSEICNLGRDAGLLEEIMVFVTGGDMGPQMHQQYADWMTYKSTTFDAAQHDVEDRNLKISVMRWRMYCKYRLARTRARYTIDRLKIGGTRVAN